MTQPTFGESTRPVWSPDGTQIAFVSYSPGLYPGSPESQFGLNFDIFVKDLASGAVSWVSAPPTGPLNQPGTINYLAQLVFSPHGTKIAFNAHDGFLYDAGWFTNSSDEIYVHDLTSDTYPSGVFVVDRCAR